MKTTKTNQAQIDNGPWLLPPPWLPVPYEMSDVSAIQALSNGTANEDQQKRALKWIVRNASGYADLGWHPDQGCKDFAAGRRFVSLQIEKLIHIDKAAVFGGNTNVQS